MKKWFIATIACLLLTGCDNGVPSSSVSSNGYIKPSMRRISSFGDGGFSYVIDDNTGVVYIQYDSTNQYGITPAYKLDGSLLSEDDIKINKSIEDSNVNELTEESAVLEQFEDVTTSDDIEGLSDSMGAEAYNQYICSMLPEDCLHPITIDNIEDRGLYKGAEGVEGYNNWYVEYTVHAARQCGYDKETYPYWVRDDGCKMLGDYIICAADYNVHPYGTIVDTSLGKGIIIETGGTVCKADNLHYSRDIELATTWH